MLLKSLTFYNFRQYKGKQELKFATDKQKNVTIVLGKNTSGKTTLVQAFNWALYDVIPFEDKTLLNLDTQNEMIQNSRERVYVEIELIHDNTNYNITRSLEYNCDNYGNIKPEKSSTLKVTYREKDGQTEIIRATEHKNTINKILPDSLSDYFFFDGERIENIGNRKDVSEAVKGLMGLAVLGAAMNHLSPNKKNSVHGKFKAAIDLGGDQKAVTIQKNLDIANENKNNVEEAIKIILDEIEYYRTKKEELAQFLRDNEKTAEFQREKDRLTRSIEIKTNELIKNQKSLVSDFNNESFAYFSQILADKAIKILSTVEKKTVGIPEMNVKAIEYIIKRGKCICGSELKEDSEAFENVLNEMKLLPPNSIGTIVRQFTDKAETYNSVNERYYNNVVTVYKQMRKCKEDISNLEYDLKNVSAEILDTKDMASVEQEYIRVKNKLKELETKKDRLLRDKGGYESDIKRYQKEYDSLAAISDKNKKVLKYLEYTNEIYTWFSNTYSKKEREILEKITEKVNNIFSKMYHGKRKVVIDKKYRVELLTSYGDKDVKSDESRGLETVKNFAFIAGLVDLAREKITSSDDNDEVLSSEPYPLVMDAPFSNADEIHVRNISKILPNFAEQVIMVVMEKDWKFAEDRLTGKVGKKYRLDKQSETLTYIKDEMEA